MKRCQLRERNVMNDLVVLDVNQVNHYQNNFCRQAKE